MAPSDRPAGRGARPWLWAVMAVYLAALAVAVLAPQPLTLPVETWSTRLRLHGLPPGWLADFIRNWLLFLPLGAGAVWWGLTGSQAVAAGFGLSFVIELTQLLIPGRFGSPADLMANTLGAATGAAVVLHGRVWLAPPAARARGLALAACAASAAALLTSSILLEPVFPATEYYGGWTPDLARFARYPGRVLEARVGTTPIVPSGPAPDSRALREALRSGAPWFVRAVAGAPPPATAPLVTIHDRQQREILFVGIHASDLVVRRRTLATVVGLESPTLRLRGALGAVHPGEEMTIGIAVGESGARVEIDGGAPQPVAWTAGRSWALITGDPVLAPAALRALDALWIAMLLFPAAYGAGGAPIAWLGVGGLGVLLELVPRLGPLTASPPSQWLGAAGGVLAALWCSRRVRRADRRHGDQEADPRLA